MSVHNVLLVRRAARYCFFMIFFKNALAKMQKLANDEALLDWSPNAGNNNNPPLSLLCNPLGMMSYNVHWHEVGDRTFPCPTIFLLYTSSGPPPS
jgi:hypothetical protein